MSISEPLLTDDGVRVPEIRFPGGLPGFAGLERFALEQWGDESSPFSLLRSLEDPELSFVVVPPMLFFPEYEPDVSEESVASIGIAEPDDAMLLVIVTVRQPVQDSTANLLGPLVINVHDLRGVQAVLEPDRWSTAAPLVA
ncbi:MAG TPA: flagellar assembly protein FliW [Nocardioides sp.]|nr:flagellar assembly protein FliW [Nocardioides sp.]